MKTKIIALALGVLFAFPCVLRAEEVEIPLFEVVGIGVMPGDNPFDDAGQYGGTHIDPTRFRATINFRTLSVTIEEPSITTAQLRVYRQSTGSTVVDRSFSVAAEEMLSAGSYNMEIETEGGILIGSFEVE